MDYWDLRVIIVYEEFLYTNVGFLEFTGKFVPSHKIYNPISFKRLLREKYKYTNGGRGWRGERGKGIIREGEE